MREGRILAGRYRLVDRLTAGGMGSVWRAEHLELGSPAAVKLLDSKIADSQEALARFRREAQSAASLRSSNIVQIFDFGVDDETPYIVMELLRGKSLADRLRESRILSPEETATILSQVARATSWAHSRGIVHRDLKPSNIFLSEDANDIVVKLLDFGIAKPLQLDDSNAPVTLTGAIVGTPQYMSPEQASGKRQLDHRTDIWSFAIIAFECLTGQHAFRADTLGGLVLAICIEPLPKPSKCAKVPGGFDEWFARAANRNPDRRYRTIAEAAERLRTICGVESTSSNRTHSIEGAQSGSLSDSTMADGAGSNADTDRTTNSASTTALEALAHHSRRQMKALWIPGSLLLAGTAIGAIWATHWRSSPIPTAVTVSNSATAVLATTPLESVPSVYPTNPPLEATEKQRPPTPTAKTGLSKPPMGIPMPSASSNTPRPIPTAQSSAASVPSSKLPDRAPPEAPQCDPEIRKRIGFCPPTAK